MNVPISSSDGIVDSKASDTVPHGKCKLKSYGTDGDLLSWIEGFLSGREQIVLVNMKLSECKPAISGIPQSSVFGPLLFVIYINDSPDVACSNILLFASNTKTFRPDY